MAAHGYRAEVGSVRAGFLSVTFYVFWPSCFLITPKLPLTLGTILMECSDIINGYNHLKCLHKSLYNENQTSLNTVF